MAENLFHFKLILNPAKVKGFEKLFNYEMNNLTVQTNCFVAYKRALLHFI